MVNYIPEMVINWTNNLLFSDINECLQSPCVHGSCSNFAGSFQCNCDAGWTGALCDICIVYCCVSLAPFNIFKSKFQAKNAQYGNILILIVYITFALVNNLAHSTSDFLTTNQSVIVFQT